MPPPDASITFLPVRDLEATHRFYHGVLGLPLALDQGTCRIYRVAGDERAGGFIGFCRREDVNVADGVIVTIVRDDVDEAHAHLSGADWPTDGPPRLHPDYQIYHFYTRDPDGWSVEIQRFEDPRWGQPPS